MLEIGRRAAKMSAGKVADSLPGNRAAMLEHFL